MARSRPVGRIPAALRQAGPAVAVAAALALLGGCHRAAGPTEPAEPPPLTSLDPWRLTIDRPGAVRVVLGNGYLGVTASQEGWAADGQEQIPAFVSGYYLNESLAPGPRWAALGLEANGRRLSPVNARKYAQTLDLRRGVLSTRYEWPGPPTIGVEVTLFPARHDPYLGVLRLSLRPSRPCAIRLARTVWRPPGCAAQVVDLVETAGRPAEPLVSDEVALHGDAAWTLTRFAGVCADGAIPEATRRAWQAAERARRQGFNAVLARHTAAWERLWRPEIRIEGDARAQQVVNAFRYYLLSSVREGRADSVPPMGLSSDLYQGHIFWDADIWVFPALVPQYPELARTIVEYRYRTLPAARRNARRQGLPGADFAWESAESGNETVSGEFRKGRHVNADIALAQWQYYLWTGDRGWLRSRGFPVLRATAEYWAARARPGAPGSRYEIRDVLGPDETRGVVSNNAFTNAMARLNLEVATQAARIVGARPDPRWAAIARKLWIPFDKRSRRYLQFEGYTGGRHKQADCELLIYPARLPMPPDVAARTYDYYKTRVSQVGPAMTSSIYAVIAARLGRRREAAARFAESWEPFLVPPYHLFSEKRTRPRTCFITGLAGCLQSILYGFAGLEPTEAGLRARPLAPSGWSGLRVTGIRWRGQVREVRASGAE